MTGWIIGAALALAGLFFGLYHKIRKVSPPVAGLSSPPLVPVPAVVTERAASGPVATEGQRKTILAIISILVVAALLFAAYKYWTENTGEVLSQLRQIPFYGYAIGGATIVSVLLILTSPSHLVGTRVKNALFAFGVLSVAVLLMNWMSGLTVPQPRPQPQVAIAPQAVAPVVEPDTDPSTLTSCSKLNHCSFVFPLENGTRTEDIKLPNVEYRRGGVTSRMWSLCSQDSKGTVIQDSEGITVGTYLNGEANGFLKDKLDAGKYVQLDAFVVFRKNPDWEGSYWFVPAPIPGDRGECF